MIRFAILLGLISACGANSTGIEPIECPPAGTTLTYANFGDEFFAANCTTAGCHERKSPVMTTQTAIQQNTSSILDEAVYTDAMPENHDMSLAERKMLQEWLACGAP